MKPLRLAIACAVCVLGLSACGSSGTSKADYVKQADAICAKGDAQIKAVPMPLLTGAPATILKNLGTYVDRVLPVAQHVIGQLKALKQPSADKAVLQRYYAALDDAVARLGKLSVAAHQGDAKAVQSGAQALNSAQPDTLARQYGFKRCGGTGGTTGA